MSTTTIPAAENILGLAQPTEQRPRRASAVSASLTFARRELLKIRRVPEELFDTLAIPILFTLLFTYMFGGALTGSTGAYLQFLLPGALVLSVVLLTPYTGVGLNTDITKGVFDRYRSLPIWRPAPLVGLLLGGAVRSLLASGLVIGLGLVMGYRPAGGVTGVLAAVGLITVFSFSLSWAWTTLGLLARTPRAVSVLGFVVQFPLTFASNIFVDPATMPSWLRVFIEDINPISYLVTAERGLMAGAVTAGDLAWVFVASALLILIFAPLTMHLYRSKP